MQIAIRKENNGNIYIDARSIASGRFTPETLQSPPYNFKIVEVPNDVVGNLREDDFDSDLNFSQEKHNYRLLQDKLKIFRTIREIECFQIINRGQLWYKNLSEEQISELQTWYSAWLDITETLTFPTKPMWLSDAKTSDQLNEMAELFKSM